MNAIEKPSWTAWLRGIAQSNTVEGYQARLVLRIGGRVPHEKLATLDRMLELERIDAETHEMRTDAVLYLREMYDGGQQVAYAPTNSDDWADLPRGGHMRRRHLGGAYR